MTPGQKFRQALRDEKPLQMIVSTTKQGMILWSISGLEGTLESPKARVSRDNTQPDAAPSYDYQALNGALYEIASRRWKGKIRPIDTYEIILQADPDIPYETIVHILDAVRRKLPVELKSGQKLPEMKIAPAWLKPVAPVTVNLSAPTAPLSGENQRQNMPCWLVSV